MQHTGEAQSVLRSTDNNFGRMETTYMSVGKKIIELNYSTSTTVTYSLNIKHNVEEEH